MVNIEGPRRRSDISYQLSLLKGFTNPDPGLEQVPTPPERASDLLWEAAMRGDIAGKKVVDLGCGPGRLAIGAALLGARSVTGVDWDRGALAVARENLKEMRKAGLLSVRIRWLTADVAKLPPLEAETILMNPPFGVQKKGAEKPFLEAAFSVLSEGGGLYFFAAPGSQTFIERSALTRDVKVEDHSRSVWPFPHTFKHHTQRMGRVTVDRWILRRERTCKKIQR
jgi:putative methylase